MLCSSVFVGISKFNVTLEFQIIEIMLIGFAFIPDFFRGTYNSDVNLYVS